MSIGTVSSATPSYAANSQQSTMQQNFQDLVQALQSGNLSAAQQAYATLTQNAPAQGAAGSASGQSNPFQQAMASIGSALQSGNISGAQAAMQGLQQTMKAHHGHHHHHGSQSQSTTTQNSTGISTLTTATNSLVNISA
jgi:soluble cytochrome b562